METALSKIWTRVTDNISYITKWISVIIILLFGNILYQL